MASSKRKMLPWPFDVLSWKLLIVIFVAVGITVFSGFRIDVCAGKHYLQGALCVVENYPLAIFALLLITSPFIFKEKFDLLTKGKLAKDERKKLFLPLVKDFLLTIIFLIVLYLILKFL